MASGTIKAVASKADIANKPDGIYLGSSDTTWADVWAKISTLASGRCTTFYATADAAKVLTDNARGNTMYGTIARQTSSSFFLVIGHSTTNNQFSVAYLNANSSGVNTYNENNLTETLENVPRYKYLTASEGENAYTVNSNSRMFIVFIAGSGTTRMGTMHVYASATGAINYFTDVGSGLSFSKGTNKINITATGGGTGMYCIIFQGDITKDA